MRNEFFPDERITENDLFFVCYMIERVARRLRRRNAYVVNAIGKSEFKRLLSVASAQHCENPESVEDEWIEAYCLEHGSFDITNVDADLCENVPSATAMGKVYMRLIRDTMRPDEDYADAIVRVYNDSICEKIDDYNASAYYEPSYVIARAYNEGGF